MKEPQDPKVRHPLAGPRRPDYVIEVWVAKELRDRVRRNGISLAEALQVGKEPDRGPADPEREDKEAEQPPHGGQRPNRLAPNARDRLASPAGPGLPDQACGSSS